MSDDAPTRLKHAHATSPELAQALRALGQSSDGERLQRVAQQLESVLAGAAPQPTAAGGLGSLALKWVIVGALAASGFWAWRGERSQPSAAVSTRPAGASQQAASAATTAPVLAAVGGEAVPATPSPVDTEARPIPVPAKPRASARGERHPKAPSAAIAAASTQRATSDANAATPVANADDIAKPPAPVPNEAPPTPPALHERSHSQPPPAAASQADGERSEAALLLAARKAQPSAALHLLDEHATRFPDGLLAPEREVLRIEALRKLGRTDEADRLLHAFQARYPDSLHLHRLLAPQRD